MNRRDALRKLGAGGAAVIGSSMIVSSPAFADGGSSTSRPTLPGAPTVNASSGFSGTFTFAQAACPFPGPGPAWARIDIRIYQETGSGSLTPTDATYSIGAVGGNPGGRTSTLRTISGTTAGQSITLRYDMRYVCREPGGPSPGTPAWRCTSYRQTFTNVLGLFMSAGTITIVAGSDACAAPS